MAVRTIIFRGKRIDNGEWVFTLDDCIATKEQIAEAWNRRVNDGRGKAAD